MVSFQLSNSEERNDLFKKKLHSELKEINLCIQEENKKKNFKKLIEKKNSNEFFLKNDKKNFKLNHF